MAAVQSAAAAILPMGDDAVRAAVEDSDFRDAGLQQNLQALERGYHETTVHKFDRRAAA
mgnify:CR=1 FL=1